MKSFKTEGIIIKRRNIGEADRIITAFTKYHGKLQIKATGVRKITSRRSSHIELLNRANLSLYQGRSLPILTEVQSLEDFSDIKQDLTKVGFAYHICELIDGLCAENQEQKHVFDLLNITLSRMCTDQELSVVVHDFEMSLLRLLGFFPQQKLVDNFNTTAFIEQILEKKLKTRQILPRLSD
jgi:DNA repair protein RecO (recombination protein O)